MTREKQPIDINILNKVIEVKNLERTLRDDNPSYQNPESLRKLEGGKFTDAEDKIFVERYRDFVDNYINDIVSERLQAIYDENIAELEGTPEGKYIENLARNVRKSIRQNEDAYDIELDDLGLSIRTANCLKNDNIKYIGQLVQMKETEMLRKPNFGRRSLREMKEVLDKHGLNFGMEIDYVSPEERNKEVE
jgi:hypothetical protein|tara:strand:+ start:3051 stop:3626 length:576 start_codon:yes stop_codon:yes gene_type:complete